MRKINLLGLFIISVLLFASCTNKGNLKVGLLLPNSDTEYFTNAQSIMVTSIEEAGGEVLTKSCDEDENLQIKQADDLIEAGAQVLIVSAVNANTAGAIVRMAKENHVKVIAYDRIISNCDLDYYITYNSVKVGNLMAEYAIQRKPKGKYILFYGDNSDRNAIFVKQGFHDVLDPHVQSGDITLLYRSFTDGWKGENAFHTLERVLDFTDERPDVLLSSYDGMSTQAIIALENYGLAYDVIVTGQNGEIEAFQNIINGKQAMTVYKPAEGLAKLAAQIAIDLLNGITIEATNTLNNGRKDVPSIFLDPILIDKENIEEQIIAKGVYTRQELLMN